MTDTGPSTQIDDVIVIGQRRRNPADPFPSGQGWEGAGETGGLQNAAADMDSGGGGDMLHPCDVPEAALP